MWNNGLICICLIVFTTASDNQILSFEIFVKNAICFSFRSVKNNSMHSFLPATNQRQGISWRNADRREVWCQRDQVEHAFPHTLLPKFLAGKDVLSKLYENNSKSGWSKLFIILWKKENHALGDGFYRYLEAISKWIPLRINAFRSSWTAKLSLPWRSLYERIFISLLLNLIKNGSALSS